MKILENLDGGQITTIISIIVVAIALIFVVFFIKSCTIEESEMYLKAGCEKIYIPGRSDPVWTNCKKSLEDLK